MRRKNAEKSRVLASQKLEFARLESLSFLGNSYLVEKVRERKNKSGRTSESERREERVVAFLLI